MSAVKKERDVVFNHPFHNVVKAFIDAMHKLGMRTHICDLRSGFIRATTEASLTSWGEEIEVYLRQLNPASTSAHITSDSALATTLVDWGTNKKNIENLLNTVSQFLVATPMR